ncbi:MAG TPA: tetratricopeptide repeat protein [Isosphaeraceae bacterium]|jgi:tetratricopeptide (TPR) repeat protein|nr:tetratricopeptide repeat protein [Isosphaeraceae bacterium]
MKDEQHHARTPRATEHAPVVVHHPEQDETLLARWLRLGMERGTGFWLPIAAGAALIVVAILVATNWNSGGASDAQAWVDLSTAGPKDAEARVKITEQFPDTVPAAWAKLQLAGIRFDEGVDKLATDRDTAVRLLEKAAELYDQVAKGKAAQAKDSPLARAAAFGLARCDEARNEPDRAIEQYEKVASRWPDSPEAKEAAKLAQRLKQPEARDFYKRLYAYVPTQPSIPPSDEDRSPLDSILKSPGPNDFILPPVFPPDAEAKKAEAKKAEAKPAPAPEKAAGRLPSDVFAPGKK